MHQTLLQLRDRQLTACCNNKRWTRETHRTWSSYPFSMGYKVPSRSNSRVSTLTGDCFKAKEAKLVVAMPWFKIEDLECNR